MKDQKLPFGNITDDTHQNCLQNSRSGTTCGHCGKELPKGLDYFRVTKVYPICRECGDEDLEDLVQPEMSTATIDWTPIEKLTITSEMENWELLLYVEQTKMCALKVPRVVTANITDGKIKVCYSHKLNNDDWRLSKITHFVWLNEPE